MKCDFATLMEGFVEAQIEGGVDAGLSFLNGARSAIDAISAKPKEPEAANENEQV